MFGLSSLPRNLDAALRDVEHRKVDVRLSALADLARLAQEPEQLRALDALVRALADPVPAVRARAALALADAGAQSRSRALLPLLEDAELSVREMALSALGELGANDDQALLVAVRKALAAEAAPLRFQAVIALAALEGERALPALVRASRDPDARVRYVALRAAEERMTEPQRADVLDAARSALDDADRDVRLAAAILLAHARDSAAHDELVAAVNARRAAREPEDEQTAIELCGELGLEAARPGLQRRAFGRLFGRDRFAWQARVALARLGDERARSSILNDLRSWSFETRTLAVAAAGRARLAEARAAISSMQGDANRADPHTVSEALALLA